MKGTRRIVQDRTLIEHVARNIIDTGSVHEYKVNDHNCKISITPSPGTFSYKFEIDGMLVEGYMEQFWKMAKKWRLFNVNANKWHICVAFRPSKSSHMVVIFDGRIAEFSSEFVAGGSAHHFLVTKEGLVVVNDPVTDVPVTPRRNSSKRPNMKCLLLIKDGEISLVVDEQVYPPLIDPTLGELDADPANPKELRSKSLTS